ncbi:MAG: HAD family hydrolase [Candidatus Omnitrophica bacterium]|nr:HAD family hydrolase [Candidatus Omnitrophota bacterium]
MKFKTIIFDFDGTLIESVGIKNLAFKEIFKDYPEYLDKIMEYHFSHRSVIRFDKFKFIFEEIIGKPYTKEIEEKVSSKFSQYVYEKCLICPLVVGAKEFLDYFFGKIPLYLATINPENQLKKILEARKLIGYFKNIYPHPWSKVDAIKEIKTAEKYSNKEILFIGDALEDYQAAKATGVCFIGRNKKDAFENADIPVFDNFFEINNFIYNNTNFILTKPF